MFCNFDDDVEEEEVENVITMQTAIQRFADGIEVLGYENSDFGGIPALIESHGPLSAYGSTPSIYKVVEIVVEVRQDDWNTEIHLLLLKLALKTSVNRGP
ncbi:hypothetical protein CC78DRAFT_579018 [Lojkania enalia]|uniref:Uncharacterized protein n=1 Tax=Lojkania enalia TaxID=147567 RepID=A0A9P4N1A1_9PLEO|nr:hypothetical protein CC78DRAFT_579018 [Didymosphaeria enalia]